MHAQFILYGRREGVEFALRCMECQTFSFIGTKGKQKKNYIFKGQVRALPIGYEVIFPKEAAPEVLRTLQFDKMYTGKGVAWKMRPFIALLRKIYQAKKAPLLNAGAIYPWAIGEKHEVHVIPIGIREDAEILDEGFTHEAI